MTPTRKYTVEGISHALSKLLGLDVRAEVETWIRAICEGIAQRLDADIQRVYDTSHPYVVTLLEGHTVRADVWDAEGEQQWLRKGDVLTRALMATVPYVTLVGATIESNDAHRESDLRLVADCTHHCVEVLKYGRPDRSLSVYVSRRAATAYRRYLWLETRAPYTRHVYLRRYRVRVDPALRGWAWRLADPGVTA